MPAKESENPQKLNFFASVFTAILGLSLANEIIQEDEMIDKADDIIFLLIGLFAIYWYRENAHKKSIMPVFLVALGTLVKIIAVAVEFSDKEAVGDDIGILVALVMVLIVVVYQYRKLK